MLKWLADLFGVGHKPEPVKEETVRVTAPAAIQAPVANVSAKVEKKTAAKPAAKAAKPKTPKATTKKTK